MAFILGMVLFTWLSIWLMCCKFLGGHFYMRVEYCILPFVYCNIHSINESTMTVCLLFKFIFNVAFACAD